MTADEIRDKLKDVKYPGFSRDIVSFGIVKDIDLGPENATVRLSIVTQDEEVAAKIVESVKGVLASLEGVPAAEVVVERPGREPHQQARQMAAAMGRGPSKPAGIARVIAIASGKGGVGKSTVASNLAVAVAGLGYRVGLLDADIYGPSVPTMFGLAGHKQAKSDADGRLLPVERHGVRLVSMGFFVGAGAPLVWRGPMLTKALTQFLDDVAWGELDYLFLDLPPGTGDVQLTLTQNVALDGGIVVTTPQDVALADVERGIKMFRQADTPVLGIIENMSFHVCPGCGATAYLFGKGGGERIARGFDVDFLGAIPLETAVRAAGDAGMPIVAGVPGSETSKAFIRIAVRLAGEARVGQAADA